MGEVMFAMVTPRDSSVVKPAAELGREGVRLPVR